MPDRRASNHLVCYDIRDDRRLRRVHRCMREWGLPLQYSVFYCYLSDRQRQQLTWELRGLIDERVDDVRIYSIQCAATIYFQGRKPLPDGMLINNVEFQEDENGSQV